MGDQNGARLALMAFLAFLLIEIGITGRLGSILASFIAPGEMVATNAASQPGTSDTSTGEGTGPVVTRPGA